MDAEFMLRHRERPDAFPDLFYFMGDRVEWALTWTASSGVLPCFRKNGGKYIQRSSMKAMTPQEKLAALGWPVTTGTAKEMGVTPMPTLDARRSAHMAGNSMHVTVASIVLLVGLCCHTTK